MTDPDMDQFYSFISHLEFNPIRLTDTGSFTCTIGSMGTHTARLRVEPGEGCGGERGEGVWRGDR